jgi:hypothetical protein
MFGGSSSVTRQVNPQYGPGDKGPVAIRHGYASAVRPLSGGSQALQMPRGGIRPAPTGVGTDLTDPNTWRRRYAFPGGNYPVVTAKQHFT